MGTVLPPAFFYQQRGGEHLGLNGSCLVRHLAGFWREFVRRFGHRRVAGKFFFALIAQTGAVSR